MLSGIFIGLGAAYCVGTYYLNKSWISSIFDKKESFGYRCYSLFIFGASPITVPIGLLLVMKNFDYPDF